MTEPVRIGDAIPLPVDGLVEEVRWLLTHNPAHAGTNIAEWNRWECRRDALLARMGGEDMNILRERLRECVFDIVNEVARGETARQPATDEILRLIAEDRRALEEALNFYAYTDEEGLDGDGGDKARAALEAGGNK